MVIITDYFLARKSTAFLKRHGWLRINIITALRGYGLLLASSRLSLLCAIMSSVYTLVYLYAN